MNSKRINWDFDYHAPNESRVKQHENVRAALRQVSHAIDKEAIDCREKSLAITKLEEAMFWANAAIARSDRPSE